MNVIAWMAFGVYVVGVTVTLGVRSWLHYRRTGDWGLRQSHPDGGTPQWWAQVLLAVGVVFGGLAPLLAATEVAPAVAVAARPAVGLVGLVVVLVGFAGVLVAQQAMGRSWRVGVDPGEHTKLVTGGVFAAVRNPVFSAMITALAGLTLMVPSWFQLLALACLVAGIQLQVRVVEEPYLARIHGKDYADYTATTGRFLPGIGRTRTASHR